MIDRRNRPHEKASSADVTNESVRRTFTIPFAVIPAVWIASIFGLLIDSPTIAIAQDRGPDVVITVSRSDSTRTIRNEGTITQWQGNQLTMLAGERSRILVNSEILSYHSTWSAEYLEAEQMMERGEFTAAIGKYKAALLNEERTWATTIIHARLVQALTATARHGEALTSFGSIIQADPDSRFVHLAPVPWTDSNAAAGLAREAQQWVKASQPVVQLIGASWLMSGAQRTQAEQLLEQLANGDDPAVAAMATAQLWRTVLPQVNEGRVNRWKEQLSQMPEEVRAGPWFIIGTAEGQLNRINDSVLSLMHARILHPDAYAIGAAALYKSAVLLQNDGQTEQAEIMRQELLTRFRDSSFAQQLNQGGPVGR